MPRPLDEIAREIEQDYADKGKPVYYAAKPYVDAMKSLNSIDDMYGCDSADSIVRYLLGNLSYWRGDKAKAIKAELREML